MDARNDLPRQQASIRPLTARTFRLVFARLTLDIEQNQPGPDELVADPHQRRLARTYHASPYHRPMRNIE